MLRWALTAVLVCVPAMWVFSQEADVKGEKKGRAKREYKGQLPSGWTEIGLQPEQIEKIKAAQIASNAKAKPIEEELEKLRKQEMELREELSDIREALDAELYGLLTNEQLKKLEEVKAKKVRDVLQKRGGAGEAKP